MTLALDDTPTKRSWSHDQGAGEHHNPTPGPAGSSFVHGQVFVVLGLLVRHSTGTFELYGAEAVKRYKTFPATWKSAGGVIRVRVVDEPSGWRAYFCSDPNASVADILGPAADRFSLEITCREVKQVVGPGQQQVRFIGARMSGRSTSAWGPSR